MRLRITDLGAAKFFSQKGKEDFQGTLTYVSPEMIQREQTGPACDLWALGVIIYLFFAGVDNPPF
jgi:serine/threonine protein kinase